MSEFDTYKSYIAKDDVVYDIGAHIGELTRLFIAHGAKTYAFEPSPNNYPILLSNLKDWDGIKTNVFNVAISDKTFNCRTQFKDCRTDYIDASGKKQDTEQDIQYVNLQEFMENNSLPAPNFIKMDIEGMESVVMNSLVFLLSLPNPPIFYIELHAQPRNMDEQNYENNPHWKWTEQGGFDFDTFKKYGYVMIDPVSGQEVLGTYNPQEGTHKGYIFKSIK